MKLIAWSVAVLFSLASNCLVLVLALLWWGGFFR